MIRQPPWPAVAATLIFGLTVLWLFAPILANPRIYGYGDYEPFLAMAAVQRDSIITHQQLPLWNPYLRGGMPLLAHPQSSFLYPTFGLILLFGEMRGVVIDAVLHFFLGLVGFYWLGRHFRFSFGAAIFSAMLFVFSSLLTIYFSQGWFLFLTISLIPWVMLSFERARAGANRFAWVTAGLLGLFLLRGDIYHYAYLFLLLSLYSLLIESGAAWFANIRLTFRLFGLSLLLTAFKVIPMILFVLDHPRPTRPNLYKMDLATLFMALFSRDIIHDLPQFWEYANYIGPLCGLGLICAIPYIWRRHRHWLLIGLFFGLFCLGDNFGLSVTLDRVNGRLWAPTLDGLLHHLPLFDSLQNVSRLVVMLGFSLCIMLGLALTELIRLIAGLKHQAVRAYLLFIVAGLATWQLADLLRYDRAILARYTESSIDFNSVSQPFAQVRTTDSAYQSYRKNLGSLGGYDPIFPATAVRALAQGEPDYHGEAFLAEGQGSVKLIFFSPNRLILELKHATTGLVVLNQNARPGWRARTDRGRLDVTNWQGCLAIRFQGGPERIVIEYAPAEVPLAGLISGLTLLLGLVRGAAWNKKFPIISFGTLRGWLQFMNAILWVWLIGIFPVNGGLRRFLSGRLGRWLKLLPIPIFLLMLLFFLLERPVRVLLQDDFHDEKYVQWRNYDGHFQVQSGEYRFDGVAPAIALAGSPKWQDYLVWFDLLRGRDAGIFLRAQDSRNAVVLIIRQKTREIYWHVRQDGEWGPMLGVTRFDLPDELYRIKVVVEGDHYQAYVNGILTTELQNRQFHRGEIAVYASGEAGQAFDNVEVQALPRGPMRISRLGSFLTQFFRLPEDEPDQPSPGLRLWADDFDQPEPTRWERFGESFEFARHRLVYANPPGFITAGALTWQDYVLEVDLVNPYDIGVFVRAQNSDDAVACLVNIPKNIIYWHIRRKADWGEMFHAAPLNPKGSRLHLKIVIEGELFQAYIDGQLKTTLRSRRYLTGKIGLYACCQPGQAFDNLVVYQPSNPIR